ncbi:hypothetical protein [Labrys monachus]|uniref:Histidine-specific methyltransferase SAM-dependent domain-containing protein n=1 Tax=Labrys monachus TaxID=217067 RepID=A0ABU0FH01_9HYPH|nr:hypothetical protein [Labrys monachus]MDQ0393896.1 hypothetical protein [Labrys monachus]
MAPIPSAISGRRAPPTALTREGISLPVIDVTDPRFHIAEDPPAMARLYKAVAEGDRGRRWIPAFVVKAMLRALARRSLLAQAMFGSDGSYLDGLSTYVLKLGPANLPPPFDGPADRRFAALPHVTFLRLRTQQVARMLADGIARAPAAAGAPLHLVNIGGGPAIDSLNALILLKRDRASVLERPIAIHVLDGDDAGPFFGANALAALQAPGCPLEGLDVTFGHRFYDWNDFAALEELVRELVAGGALLAASSEGALFEYGDDSAIIGNLRALRSAELVVGSVTRGDKTRRDMIANSRFKLFPRGLEGFEPLARQAGFEVAASEPGVLSDQVALRPAGQTERALS